MAETRQEVSLHAHLHRVVRGARLMEGWAERQSREADERPIARPQLGRRNPLVPQSRHQERALLRKAVRVNRFLGSIRDSSGAMCPQQQPSFAEGQRGLAITPHSLKSKGKLYAVGLEE